MNYNDFILALNVEQLTFVQELNEHLMANNCTVAFEEKKTGLAASYKFGKPPRALIYLQLKNQNLVVRIYGEGLDNYRDFLNTLPSQMIAEIEKAAACKRLTQNGCSPKCTGYDFTISATHYQKCRYGGFEFLVKNDSAQVIKEFIKKEIEARRKA